MCRVAQSENSSLPSVFVAVTLNAILPYSCLYLRETFAITAAQRRTAHHKMPVSFIYQCTSLGLSHAKRSLPTLTREISLFFFCVYFPFLCFRISLHPLFLFPFLLLNIPFSTESWYYTLRWCLWERHVTLARRMHDRKVSYDITRNS